MKTKTKQSTVEEIRTNLAYALSLAERYKLADWWLVRKLEDDLAKALR